MHRASNAPSPAATSLIGLMLIACSPWACTTQSPTTAPLRSEMTDRPPSAPTRPHVTEVHNVERTDDYFWLRERSNPEVRAYLEAENSYTDAYMADSEELEKVLYKEIKDRIQETDVSVPYQKGDWLYFSRTAAGAQYPTYWRQPVGSEGEEGAQVILDLNALAEGEPFMAVGTMSVSPDGNLLAYTTDNTGYRQYSLHVKNLVDGSLFSDTVAKVCDVAWAMDNQTLFYVVEDGTKRPYRLYRHRLGSPNVTDPLIYEEADERFRVGVYRTLSDDSIVLSIASHTTRESRLVPADRPEEEFRLVRAREQDHEYTVQQRGDTLFIRTNDTGPNFRLVTAPVSDPTNWTERLPHRDTTMLEQAAVFADFLVLTERVGGLRQLRFLGTDGTDFELDMPDAVYELGPETNAQFDTHTFRFAYQSMLTPQSIYDFDVRSRTKTLRKQAPVLGDYAANRYATERLFAVAADGEKIPISVAYRKDLPRDGSAPVHLVGYGAYGVSYPAHFSHARISLLDRGFVCAIAHIRGGGEMGKRWHEAGRMFQKKNSFSDFIRCAEHLVASGYAAPDKVLIEGGSAGGLLVGAVLNMRPDLFNAAILNVPFVDVIHTMLDESLPLTVGEFEEWGNPKVPEQYEYIASYCPYTNLAAMSYPAILVKTSFHDSQVMYWEPAKYVAKLRTLKTNPTPLLFKTNMAGGHGGSSGRYDAWREVAFNYAFLLRQAGIRE